MSSVQFWSNGSNSSKESIINVRNAYDELMNLRKNLHEHRMRVGVVINQFGDGIQIPRIYAATSNDAICCFE